MPATAVAARADQSTAVIPGRGRLYVVARTSTEPAPALARFAGCTPITLDVPGSLPVCDVGAGAKRAVQRYWDEQRQRAIYLLGQAHHPSLSGDSLLQWISDHAEISPDGSCQVGDLQSLMGHFVVLIEDRLRRRIQLITNLMGARPMFAGAVNGRLVAGTDVLSLCDAGLTRGQINYDSLGAWLCYSVCPDGAVVDDYRRLPPGRVLTYRPDGTLERESVYAQVRYTDQVLDERQLVAGLYERITEACDRLTADLPSVVVPLSGGYDSRLLTALRVASPTHTSLVNVHSMPQEWEVAQRVADELKRPLEVIQPRSSTLDLHDEPIWFRPEGFPTFRNLTNAIARRHPGVPVLSGYLGDNLMRVALSEEGKKFYAQDWCDHDDEFLARAAHRRFHTPNHHYDLLRDGVERRAAARATASLLPLIRFCRTTGRTLWHTNLMLRNVNHFCGIFLSHEDVAPAVLPFHSWPLIDFSTTYNENLNEATYQKLFDAFHPRLGAIPHEETLHPARPLQWNRPTRHLRNWAIELLRDVPRRPELTSIVPHKLLKRAASAWLTGRSYQVELSFLYRVHRLEKRLASIGISIDWSKL